MIAECEEPVFFEGGIEMLFMLIVAYQFAVDVASRCRHLWIQNLDKNEFAVLSLTLVLLSKMLLV